MITLEEEKPSETIDKNEKTFLEFLNRDGAHYEKVLLDIYFDRIKSIFRGENPPPYELEIQPTSRCNAKCKICFGREYKRVEDKLTSQEAMQKIISESLNFREGDLGIEIVKFCGSTGDPLVNDLTLYAIEQLSGKKFLRLFTNGIALAENANSRPYLETLAKVNRLNLSIDAGTTETLHKLKPGTRGVELEQILEAAHSVRFFGRRRNSIEFGFVISNANYGEIIQFAEKVKKYGSANVIRYRIDFTDRSVSINHGAEINEALDQAKHLDGPNFKVVPLNTKEQVTSSDSSCFSTKQSGYRCYTSRIWSCVGPNGCLYPCGHIVAGDVENYGSLLDSSFQEVWNSKKRADLIERLPIKKCDICSPFSMVANETLTTLRDFPLNQLEQLHEKYLA